MAEDLANTLVGILERDGGWLTRKRLAGQHGFSKDGRDIRLARQHSAGRVICGQRGFKATKFATSYEFWACRRQLLDQVAAMRAEVEEMDRAWRHGARRVRQPQDDELQEVLIDILDMT